MPLYPERTGWGGENRTYVMNDEDPFDVFLMRDGEKKMIEQPDTKIPKCSTFIFTKEDHTLGALLASYARKNPAVVFCAYKVPHPLMHTMEVRIQTEESTEVTPKDVLKHAVLEAMADAEKLKTMATNEFFLKNLAKDPNRSSPKPGDAYAKYQASQREKEAQIRREQEEIDRSIFGDGSPNGEWAGGVPIRSGTPPRRSDDDDVWGDNPPPPQANSTRVDDTRGSYSPGFNSDVNNTAYRRDSYSSGINTGGSNSAPFSGAQTPPRVVDEDVWNQSIPPPATNKPSLNQLPAADGPAQVNIYDRPQYRNQAPPSQNAPPWEQPGENNIGPPRSPPRVNGGWNDDAASPPAFVRQPAPFAPSLSLYGGGDGGSGNAKSWEQSDQTRNERPGTPPRAANNRAWDIPSSSSFKPAIPTGRRPSPLPLEISRTPPRTTNNSAWDESPPPFKPAMLARGAPAPVSSHDSSVYDRRWNDNNQSRDLRPRSSQDLYGGGLNTRNGRDNRGGGFNGYEESSPIEIPGTPPRVANVEEDDPWEQFGSPSSPAEHNKSSDVVGGGFNGGHRYSPAGSSPPGIGAGDKDPWASQKELTAEEKAQYEAVIVGEGGMLVNAARMQSWGQDEGEVPVRQEEPQQDQTRNRPTLVGGTNIIPLGKRRVLGQGGGGK